MQVGIVTRSFPEMTNEQRLNSWPDRVYRDRLCLSQTDSKYWAYNGMSDLGDLTEARVSEIADIYRRHGISVHALGVFTNLIEEDDARRAEILAYFERHMQYARAAGIPIVSTECGFDPASRGVRADVYEARFNRLLDALRYLCDKAEQYDLTVALEPCVIDIVPSAKRMADTIGQVGSPRLKVLLDPANLIANSSERDMFIPGPTRIFHGKDRRSTSPGEHIGEARLTGAVLQLAAQNARGCAVYHRIPARRHARKYCGVRNTTARPSLWQEVTHDSSRCQFGFVQSGQFP